MKILCPLIALVTLNAHASELLAGRNGNFDNHDKCLVYSDHVLLQQGADIVNHISYTRAVAAPSERINDLADVALSNASVPRYRWSIDQVDYVARESQETFYATGFRNISNDSLEARELIQLIDKLCQGPLPAPRIVGKFEILLKTTQHEFIDFLTIQSKKDFRQQYSITGEYEVPGIFSSRVNGLKADQEDFSFKIHVVEGESSYDALFEGRFISDDEMVGSAITLPKRELLGRFTGKRIKNEK